MQYVRFVLVLQDYYCSNRGVPIYTPSRYADFSKNFFLKILALEQNCSLKIFLFNFLFVTLQRVIY